MRKSAFLYLAGLGMAAAATPERPAVTRAAVMELRAIGKSCCSPFTASDPET